MDSSVIVKPTRGGKTTASGARRWRSLKASLGSQSLLDKSAVSVVESAE